MFNTKTFEMIAETPKSMNPEYVALINGQQSSARTAPAVPPAALEL